jgi:hypothetical protein
MKHSRVLVFAFAALNLASRGESATAQTGDFVNIRFIVNDTTLTAEVIDSPTARDFISLLPLTLSMSDLFKREKYGELPRAISDGGERTHTYALGDVAYWSPGPDVAVYYRDDGERIPDPGIIVIGNITSGLEAFDVPGSVNVTIESAE